MDGDMKEDQSVQANGEKTVTMSEDVMLSRLNTLRVRCESMSGLGMDWQGAATAIGMIVKEYHQLKSDRRVLRVTMKGIADGVLCPYVGHTSTHGCPNQQAAKLAMNELGKGDGE